MKNIKLDTSMKPKMNRIPVTSSNYSPGEYLKAEVWIFYQYDSKVDRKKMEKFFSENKYWLQTKLKNQLSELDSIISYLQTIDSSFMYK